MTNSQQALTHLALDERDDARALAKRLLALGEIYISLDVSASALIREETAEAQRKIAAWEEKKE